MFTILVVVVLAGLFAAGLFIVSQWQHRRIRHTGTRVTAQVTQVRMWQDPTRPDFLLLSRMIPFSGGRWWYEISAEWTDPRTEDTYVFTSGIKKGLPRYRQGDHLSAYMSPYGNDLELS